MAKPAEAVAEIDNRSTKSATPRLALADTGPGVLASSPDATAGAGAGSGSGGGTGTTLASVPDTGEQE